MHNNDSNSGRAQDNIRIVVLISGGGSNLQAIIDNCQSGVIECQSGFIKSQTGFIENQPGIIESQSETVGTQSSHNVTRVSASIELVISNRPGVYGLERSKQAGIDSLCIDHKQYPSREDFDAALITAIKSTKPDLVVLSGFMRILTPEFVNNFHGRLLNIHPSLLPKYPGLHTHQRAIEAGDSEAGVTVHFVTAELDGGPAIIQARVPVLKNDDADALAARVLEQEHKIYPTAISWFAEGRLSLTNGKAMLDNEILPPQGFDYQG